MAASIAASTCSAAVYKMAPFMQHPAPAGNIYELLAPVWWVMDGHSLGSYPWSSFGPQVLSYATKNGKAPVGGILALCALVLLSLLVFMTWRFVRCIKVVCCQQESYADASKVLCSKRLRVAKGLTILLGLAACGAAALGMISLNKNILPALNARIDSMQEFPAKVVQQVSTLANETAALSRPLSNISSIIDSIDTRGIRQDLQHVAAFLEAAPSPTALKQTLQQLSSALKPELYEGLRLLDSQINVASESSSLATLRGYLKTLAAFDISTMGPAIRTYSDALSAVYELVTSRRSNAEVQASPEFAALKSAYEQIDLEAWVPYIDQAAATANALNAMRTPATNPFTLTIKTLASVSHTVDSIRGGMLDSLSASVKQFNGLWHNNASVAFESLLLRAAHLNHTVLELPRDVESKLQLVNASVSDFLSLYKGEDSLLTLPQRIEEAGAKLVMPNAADLVTDLKAAEGQLNDARGLPELVSELATLARALDKTLRNAKANIQPSLDAFATDTSMRMDLADTLTFEGPVVEGAATLFESANLEGMKTYVKGVLEKLEVTLAPAKKEAEAIPGVLKQISEFDLINSFMPPLAQAESVYRQFDGNPATLTKPVFEMLDRVEGIGSTDLVNAQALVANMSSSVQKMSNSIQSATVEQVDRFQSNYLGTRASSSNATAAAATSGTDNLVKAMHTVYYAMIGAYAAIIGLTLVVMVMSVLNCPAGVCFSGFSLNTALAVFSAIPLVITVGLLLMRDTCGNMETLASRAVAQTAGNSSIPAAVSQFYLTHNGLSAGSNSSGASGGGAGAGSLPDVIKGINADYDVEGFKARVQQSVDEMLKGVTDDFTFRPQVSSVVNDATSRIDSLLHSMDSVLLTLDHASVSGVYNQGKSFFCCTLTQQIYTQWAATITVIALALVALQCAMFVLSNLDSLSESCCRFRPFRSKDYGGVAPITSSPSGSKSGGFLSPKKHRLIGETVKPLQSIDSNSSETVAVISLGGAGMPSGGAAAPSKSNAPSVGKSVSQQNASNGAPAGGSQLPDCTPLPAPLALRTVAPAVVPSPQRAAGPATLDMSPSGAQRSWQQQQQGQMQQQQQQLQLLHQQHHRRPRVGEAPPRPAINITAVYPSITPTIAPQPGSPSALQRQQEPQQWATTQQGMPGKGLVRAPCTRI